MADKHTWPAPNDYYEAVQNLATSVADQELQEGQVAENALGLPLVWSGNFAHVFKVHCPKTDNTWALKCFTRETPGLRERYRQIAAYLEQSNLPFMVDFQFLEPGIRAGGQWYPLLKMRWVEGFTLNTFVEDYLSQPRTLRRLLRLWMKLATRLREADLAHADLQHGNVLLVPRAGGQLALKLVDYDGMYVPPLSDTSAVELGHPAYQHPGRNQQRTYNPEVDRFSHLAIYTAIRCLIAEGRPLWERFNNGENLLFSESDFRDPSNSELFQVLRELDNRNCRTLAERLILACEAPLEESPLLDEVATNGKVRPLNSRDTAAVNRILAPAGLPPVTKRQTPLVEPPSGESESVDFVEVYAIESKVADLLDRHATKSGIRKPFRLLAEVALGLLRRTRRLLEREGHTSSVSSIAFSPDGSMLASGSYDRTVRLWNVIKRTQLRTFLGHTDWVNSVTFSPDGTMVASGGDDHTARLWEVATGNQLRTFGHTSYVTSLAFSPDGSMLASGSCDNLVRLWDVATGKPLQTLEGHTTWVRSVVFSPNGSTLASGSADKTVRLWKLTTGEELLTLEGHTDFVRSVAFSPDGTTLASGSDDNTVRLWKVSTGNQLRTFGHTSHVTSVAFSPDGATLALGSYDNIVELWDVTTGKPLRTLEGHSAWVLSVAFNPDGSTLASGSHDKTVRFWGAARLWGAALGESARIPAGR